jgi:serine/threonine-protein kinase RsbW
MDRGSTAQAPEGCGGIVVRTPADGWVELTAPSREEHLERIASLLDRLSAERVDSALLEDVKIAVTEVASNAMEWGNASDARRKVHVSYGLFPDEIVFKVEDEGEGFDPDCVPDPVGQVVEMEFERMRAGKRLGGFGLHVARSLMDRVLFSERGNVVILTKRLCACLPRRDGTSPVCVRATARTGRRRRQGDAGRAAVPGAPPPLPAPRKRQAGSGARPAARGERDG